MAELPGSSRGSTGYRPFTKNNGDAGRVSIANYYRANKKNTMRGMVVHNGEGLSIANAMLYIHGVKSMMLCQGYSALEKIASGEIFHIIVIGDLFPPDISGLELTRRIRMMVGNRATIISISANLSDDARRLYIAAGVNYFLENPLGYEELFPIIAERFLASTPSML